MSTLLSNIVTVFSLILGAISILITFRAIEKMRKRERVIVAEAGKISDMSDTYQPYVFMNSVNINMRERHGIAIPLDYQRVFVHGHCMEPRGIRDCSQLLVKSIDVNKDFSLQVKHDDILLIYLPDKNIYKLRVFDKYLDDNNLITYRYNPQTKARIDSSLPHKRENVVGVVKYKYA